MTFKYFSPSSLDEAAELLREHRGQVIAGGTDLLRLVGRGIVDPVALVSLDGVPEMKKIEKTDSNLEIGASVTLQEIENSPIIKDEFPMLAEAAHLVGTPQVRNMATIGGNLLQNVQCWYHRNLRFDCFRRGGGTCQVPGGSHGPHHAISNAVRCFAAVPSDMAPALAALGAAATIKGEDGKRTVAVEGIHLNAAPWTAVGRGEILCSVEVPLRSCQGKFIKHRNLEGHSYAIASAAVALAMRGNKCVDARIFLGSVSPALLRAVKAEEMVKGEAIGEELADKAAESTAQDFVFSRLNPWKAKLAKSVCRQAILGAANCD